MKPYCLVPQRDGVSHDIYEGNPAWPAIPVGYLRPAYGRERALSGRAAYIVFDQALRPFDGDSPEAALEAFAGRRIYRLNLPAAGRDAQLEI